MVNEWKLRTKVSPLCFWSSHHASFQGGWAESLVDLLWVDWQLDAEHASFRRVQLGNHTPDQHARVEDVWQWVDLLQSDKQWRRFGFFVAFFFFNRKELKLSRNTRHIVVPQGLGRVWSSCINMWAYLWIVCIQLLTELLGVRVADVLDTKEALQATGQTDRHLKVCDLLHAAQDQHALIHILENDLKKKKVKCQKMEKSSLFSVSDYLSMWRLFWVTCEVFSSALTVNHNMNQWCLEYWGEYLCSHKVA